MLAVGFVLAEVAWRVYLSSFASQEHLRKWARIEDMRTEDVKFLPHPAARRR